MANEVLVVPSWNEEDLFLARIEQCWVNDGSPKPRYMMMRELPVSSRKMDDALRTFFIANGGHDFNDYQRFTAFMESQWKESWVDSGRFVREASRTRRIFIPSGRKKRLGWNITVELKGVVVNKSILTYLEAMGEDASMLRAWFDALGRKEYGSFGEYLDAKTKYLMGLNPNALLKDVRAGCDEKLKRQQAKVRL